jgi:hypothetical protein
MDQGQEIMSDYRARAARIVERLLPSLPAVNPLYDAAGFVAASRRHGERERLFWRTYARLRAKAEGGKPYLALPKDCAALWGGPMWQVARELEQA